MRTATEDIEFLTDEGILEADSSDLMACSVVLLVMYAKPWHKPVPNLHKLAKAVEQGNMRAARKAYMRLYEEARRTIVLYPELVERLNALYTLPDETLDAIDAQMAEEELVAAVKHDPDFEEKFAAGELDLNDPYLAVRMYANKAESVL